MRESLNDVPLIGDVMISELRRHLLTLSINVQLTERDLAFIEISNCTRAPLDIGFWRLSGAVEFKLPGGSRIEARETIAIVRFDPVSHRDKVSAFRVAYGMSNHVLLFGPYADAGDPNSNSLDNDGKRLNFERPENFVTVHRA